MLKVICPCGAVFERTAEFDVLEFIQAAFAFREAHREHVKRIANGQGITRDD